MKKFFVVVGTILIIVLFLWLQVNFFNNIKLFGVIPNIGIVLIVSIGMSAGKNIGLISRCYLWVFARLYIIGELWNLFIVVWDNWICVWFIKRKHFTR